MALWQGRSRRKPTGGRYRPFRKKRRREIGREQQWAFIGPQRLKLYRTKGANRKVRVLSAEFANVLDRRTSATKKVKIVTVKANPSNPNFVTRNVITRGATILTEIGLARVTSRPGQDGVSIGGDEHSRILTRPGRPVAGLSRRSPAPSVRPRPHSRSR